MSALITGGGAIRKLWSTEAGVFRDHMLRLDGESRRLRFTGAVSDAYIAGYAEQAFDEDALIFGCFVDGVLRAAAELRPLPEGAYGVDRGRAGEGAFSVEQDHQTQGIGKALMRRLLLAARNRGLSKLVVTCLPENLPMQKIARQNGARIIFEDGDVVGILAQPDPSGWTLWREAVQESQGLVGRLLDARRRLTRRAA